MLLRYEGAALFVVAIVAYALTGFSWWLFVLLFLVPDLSFAAYLAGPKPGAIVYNALHATLGPAALAVTAFLFNQPGLLAVAAIWVAHIGFDRMLGYGLKYASGFNHTHLGRIGRANMDT
ncbi:DUF4260 domain-containing protein [Microvirga sp. 2MCAF38]|uniref:DUF4260 domain-containing protein n=1 Tax=Microvirga sp. 2MCAF38 TaxID=3232989 RepID=UPI003F9DB01B